MTIVTTCAPTVTDANIATTRKFQVHPATLGCGIDSGVGHAVTPSRHSGFTLMELMLVMAIVALLVTIAMPRYLSGTDKAREAVLAENLSRMREAIDSYHADRGRFPESLEDLVERKYLKRVPVDPVTESAASWVVVPPAETSEGKVADVRSGAPGKARDGREYSAW